MPVLNPCKLKPASLIEMPGSKFGIVIGNDDINPGTYYKVLVDGQIYCIHRDDMIEITIEEEEKENEFYERD